MIYCNMCNRKFQEGMTCERSECELQINKLTAPLPEQDHWTFPEDKEVEARPGWKWFKLDRIWWFTSLDAYMMIHDRVTKKGSVAQRMGLTVERLNEWQKEFLKNKGLPGKVVDEFVSRIQRFFHEGKLK